MKPAETPLMAKSLLKLLPTAFRELHEQELHGIKTDSDTLGYIRFNYHLFNYRDYSSPAMSFFQWYFKRALKRGMSNAFFGTIIFLLFRVRQIIPDIQNYR